MLENIKKKISNVIKEGIQIKENVSNQLPRVGSLVFDEVTGTELGIPSDINFAAGSELLQKYEEAYRTTYETNQINLQISNDITNTIGRLRRRIKDREVNVNDLITCLSGLPAIEASLKASLEKFDEIEELSRSAEQKIDELSELCQLVEIEKKRIKMDFEAKQQEIRDLEVVQREQAAIDRERTRLDDERIKRIQEERQAAFEEAFLADMEEYKLKGIVTKIELKPNKMLSLEDIDLDTNEPDESLEDFLGS